MAKTLLARVSSGDRLAVEECISTQLKDRTTIVPTWIVKVFFGSGALREVYTDEDMRIVYGSDGKDFSKEFIYVMTRMK